MTPNSNDGQYERLKGVGLSQWGQGHRRPANPIESPGSSLSRAWARNKGQNGLIAANRQEKQPVLGTPQR